MASLVYLFKTLIYELFVSEHLDQSEGEIHTLLENSITYLAILVAINGIEYSLVGGYQSLHKNSRKFINSTKLGCYYIVTVAVLLLLHFINSGNNGLKLSEIFIGLIVGHCCALVVFSICRVVNVEWESENSKFQAFSEAETLTMERTARVVQAQLNRVKYQLSLDYDSSGRRSSSRKKRKHGKNGSSRRNQLYNNNNNNNNNNNPILLNL